MRQFLVWKLWPNMAPIVILPYLFALSRGISYMVGACNHKYSQKVDILAVFHSKALIINFCLLCFLKSYKVYQKCYYFRMSPSFIYFTSNLSEKQKQSLSFSTFEFVTINCKSTIINGHQCNISLIRLQPLSWYFSPRKTCYQIYSQSLLRWFENHVKDVLKHNNNKGEWSTIQVQKRG